MIELNFKKFKHKFLVYAPFITKLNLFLPIVKNNRDFMFIIHINNLKKEEFLKSKFAFFENCFFYDKLPDLIFTELFDKFITTDAQQCVSHSYSNSIIDSFKSAKKKVIELQHGMSQLGMHYVNLPDDKILADDSLAQNTRADHILAFNKNISMNTENNITVMGYPGTDNILKSYSGGYILITSNLHWDVYKMSEKILFYQQISNCIFQNPKELFIWRQHLGEKTAISQSIINQSFSIHNCNPKQIKNLIIDDQFLNNQNTESLISKSSKVISSYSTTLLDCEIYSKPTIIYSAPSIFNLISKLSYKNTFSEKKPINLDYVNSSVKTGYLKSFNNSNVRKVLTS